MKRDGKPDGAGRLSIVATPIGNLEDVTMRALRTLKEATLILAEDTRRTRKLLSHYGISTPMRSLHAHTSPEKIAAFASKLEAGEDLALVTDAGTPLVSDPGQAMVDAAIQIGIGIEAIPGPSAVLTALCVAGLPTARFSFEGFLPRSGKRRAQALDQMKESTGTTVFFESPQRVKKTLSELQRVLGPGRPIALCRELTKLHEEVIRADTDTIQAHLPDNMRGEITIVLAGATKSAAPSLNHAQLVDQVQRSRQDGLSAKDAAAQLATLTNMGKRAAYQLVIQIYEDLPPTKSSGT